MTAVDFLQDLKSRGVVLTPRGNNSRIDAPAGTLTAQDRVKLARHKTELLGLLASVTTPDDLPPEWQPIWDERAAIIEYDGGLPRERAEALALLDILRHVQAAGISVRLKT